MAQAISWMLVFRHDGIGQRKTEKVDSHSAFVEMCRDFTATGWVLELVEVYRVG